MDTVTPELARISFECSVEAFNEHLKDTLNLWLESGWIKRPAVVVEFPVV